VSKVKKIITLGIIGTLVHFRDFILPGCGSVWLERCVRDAEVAGSNPVTPIFFGQQLRRRFLNTSALNVVR
jgi:hypothetical protein